MRRLACHAAGVAGSCQATHVRRLAAGARSAASGQPRRGRCAGAITCCKSSARACMSSVVQAAGSCKPSPKPSCVSQALRLGLGINIRQ